MINSKLRLLLLQLQNVSSHQLYICYTDILTVVLYFAVCVQD